MESNSFRLVRSWFRGAVLICLLLCVSAGSASGQRCATSLRGEPGRGVAALRPLARHQAGGVAASREVVPIPTETIGGDPVNVHTTEHFRVIWGDATPPGDSHWTDPDGDGVPVWVSELATALEHAFAAQAALGFPAPYGSATYYLDVYIGNTGVRIFDTDAGQWQTLAIGSNYYAYTEIDRDYAVAWFVFNDDISNHTLNELPVLRATAAHELFHAVQRALDYPWNDERLIPDARWVREVWWLEASATWAEEITFPAIDDYLVYVDDFLSAPHKPLNSTDGIREYGAAVFAGYLWELYGETDLFRDVFENAYALQLEPSMRRALVLQGVGGSEDNVLENVVSRFWVDVAAPSAAIWDDAAAYAGASLLVTAPMLPSTVYPSSTTQPGRLGANVIRVPAVFLPTTAGMDWVTSTGRWRLAAWGSGGAIEVSSPEAGVPLDGVGQAGTGWTHVAVVNASTLDGTDQYVLELGDDGFIDDDVSWRIPPTTPHVTEGDSGGGSGGCFLDVVRGSASALP